jgi:hypothetical protein
MKCGEMGGLGSRVRICIVHLGALGIESLSRTWYIYMQLELGPSVLRRGG